MSQVFDQWQREFTKEQVRKITKKVDQRFFQILKNAHPKAYRLLVRMERTSCFGLVYWMKKNI